MAKAQITTPEGVTVKLEGTAEEIAAVIRQAGQKSALGKANSKAKATTKKRPTVPALVDELKGEGFFKQPKTLGEIQKRLADLGHHYPLTALSGPMQAQCKQRILRRFKKDKKYVYAQ
jgi:hypothetical protein